MEDKFVSSNSISQILVIRHQLYNPIHVELRKGKYIERWKTPSPILLKIENSMYDIDPLSSIGLLEDLTKDHYGRIVPRPLYVLKNGVPKPVTNVCSAIRFAEMIKAIEGKNELTVDLEGNDWYSRLGLTFTIQMSIMVMDFIINGCKLQDSISSGLKPILESDEIIKYFYGMSQDVKSLKKNYFIHLVGALDVQILVQLLMRKKTLKKDNLFYAITRLLPNFENWVNEFLPIDKNLPIDKANIMSALEAKSKTLLSYEAMIKLLHPLEPYDRNCQNADFRPRSTAAYSDLMKYARLASNGIICIVEYVKAKLLAFEKKGEIEVGDTKNIFEEAFTATKRMLKLPYSMPSFGDCKIQLHQSIRNVPNDMQQTWMALFKFRDEQSVLLDDHPDSLFHTDQFWPLIQWSQRVLLDNRFETKTPNDVAFIIEKGTNLGDGSRVAPEQLDKIKKGIFDILFQNQVRYKNN